MSNQEERGYTIQSSRIDRLEEKIDQMADAIVALARAEEKIHTLSEFNRQQSEQMQTVINRLDRVEALVNSNANTVNVINKVFWIVVVGLISAITYEYITHLGS